MIIYRIVRFLAHPFFNLLYRIKVYGRENIPQDGGYIFCPNHTCNLDPVLLAVNIQRPICYMAKEELFEKRWLAPLLRLVGAFPVNRGKGDTTAIDHAIDTLKRGRNVGIFPEGTRSKTGKLLPLKSGATVVAERSGAGIVPVGIVIHGGKCKFRCGVTIRIGKPIENSEMGFEQGGTRALRTVKNRLTGDLLELTGERQA